MKQFLLISLLSLILLVAPVYSFDNTLPNNKFGIHLAQPEDQDIKDADSLVNSTGGKWGYVTLVIQENDRARDKWQGVFERLREHHLIPIIRLATVPEGAIWRKPNPEDSAAWADFLNSLEWVVKDRYIVLFNEPNHGSEWGGGTNPEDYAQVSYAFAKTLHEKNPDFFVMLAGLDASAPSAAPNYEDEATFLSRVVEKSKSLMGNEARIDEGSRKTSPPNETGQVPSGNLAGIETDKPHTIFDLIDGWSSHSYPNPGFAGSPYGSGRGSIRTYEWELEYLKDLGVTKDLPVFITETGWSHIGAGSGSMSLEALPSYYERAYEGVWLPDARVRAVTPFILSYQGEPFTQFSWKRLQQEDFYPHYYAVAAMAKTAGEPEQIEQGTIATNFPHELVASSTYVFEIKLKNEGQAIWDQEDGYKLRLGGTDNTYFFSELNSIKPHEAADIDLHFKTGEVERGKKLSLGLFKGDKKILDGGEWKFDVIPLPTLSFGVGLFPRLRADNQRRYEIQIFDARDQLVYKRSGITAKHGGGFIDKVQNVYSGGKFRVVILTDYYLPRQQIVTFKRGTNKVQFKPLIPLDFDRDGNFDLNDIGALFTHLPLLLLFVP